MDAPADDDTWVALTDEPLPVGAVADWVVLPRCGGSVVFSGTVRDHADHRTGVSRIVYEAYAEQVEVRLRAIADQARRRWPEIGRLALLHRQGPVELCESSVVVAASAPHRAEAFEAARFCIDTLKASVPIWKRESWDGGEDWALAATDVESVDALSRRLDGGAARGLT